MQVLWAAGGTALPAAPLVAPAEHSATETATGQGDAADLMIIIMMTIIMMIIMMIITALKWESQVIWYNDSYSLGIAALMPFWRQVSVWTSQ